MQHMMYAFLALSLCINVCFIYELVSIHYSRKAMIGAAQSAQSDLDDSTEYLRLYTEWNMNRTPETLAAMDKQRDLLDKKEYQRLKING